MRIVICDYVGHPFQVELSRCLAKRGHHVLHLHYAEYQTPKGELTVRPDDPPTFRVEGVSTGEGFDKRDFLKRRVLETRVGRLMAKRALRFNPDVVVGCNMPLDAQKKLKAACRRRKVPFVFWVQDIVSKAISHFVTEKLGPIGRVVGWHYGRLEARMLRSSDAVVAISSKFLPQLYQWGVGQGRIRVIKNWATLSQISPVKKDNAWSRQHSLHDKVVALYTGTMAMKHDPGLLLELALAGQASGLQVVVTSEGSGPDWLTKKKAAVGVNNLTILPFQPMNRYAEVLGTGDILLANIIPEAAGFSVPSKILSYLAAGRPIVASIAADNDAAMTIAEARAGIVVPPGQTAAFSDAVLGLALDLPRRFNMGRSARQYAENQFSVESKADEFEAIFRDVGT